MMGQSKIHGSKGRLDMRQVDTHAVPTAAPHDFATKGELLLHQPPPRLGPSAVTVPDGPAAVGAVDVPAQVDAVIEWLGAAKAARAQALQRAVVAEQALAPRLGRMLCGNRI